jgi:hypothetical protein
MGLGSSSRKQQLHCSECAPITWWVLQAQGVGVKFCTAVAEGGSGLQTWVCIVGAQAMSMLGLPLGWAGWSLPGVKAWGLAFELFGHSVCGAAPLLRSSISQLRLDQPPPGVVGAGTTGCWLVARSWGTGRATVEARLGRHAAACSECLQQRGPLCGEACADPSGVWLSVGGCIH